MQQRSQAPDALSPELSQLAWQLLDSAPDATIVADESARIVLVNLQAERLFGYSRQDLIGQPIETLIPERFRPTHVGRRDEFMQRPKTRPMGSGLELYGRRRDGSEFPVEISLSPLRIEGRMWISASIRDITDRKQNDLSLRRIQGHLLSAIESIPGAFAIFDTHDRLVLCNSAFRHLLGREIPGEIVGRTLEQVFDMNVEREVFDLSGKSAQDFRSTLHAYHRDPHGSLDLRTMDQRWLRIVQRRTTEGGTVLTIWDITDDAQREDEIRRARELAEAASSAKSEFLASMSHELRTPLNAILGFAQLLKRDKKVPLADRHQERVEHVLKGGEHLLRLIDEVLDLSRIEAGRVAVSPEPVGIPEVLVEVRTTLEPMATRGQVELVLAPVPADLPAVIADRTRLKQILMNYGSNAIKYGNPNGRAIFVTARSGDFVRVSVVDNGMGIPASKQDKIFSPFQRAGQETGPIEGTGIGLAITKRLAELMGGRVGFSSEEGEGSEFWVELPAYQPSQARGVEQGAPVRPDYSSLVGAEGPRYTVVYVEDNPANIAFIEDLLADFERVELITAPTAEIGIELIRSRRPDVVIMDIHLPGMSGFEAMRRLSEWPETRDIPVVALSAAAMVRDAARVTGAGFYRYLTKPVKVDELWQVLSELFAASGKQL